MNSQTQAQLYLADQRGHSETDSLRSAYTFNFGHYFSESRKPFGALHLLNDDILRAGSSLAMQAEGSITAILIPVVGGLVYKSSGLSVFLESFHWPLVWPTPSKTRTRRRTSIFYNSG